ncbi:MAG: phage tail tape measure protein [Pseudomonadota bacterium]
MNLERTVKILFAGEDKGLAAAVSDADRWMGKLSGGVQSVTAPMAALADNVLKLEAAFALLALGGLAYSTAAYARTENAVIELEKVMGDEAGAVDRAIENARELSDVYGERTASIVASTAGFKQAGFDAAGSMLLTRDAMDLLIAGANDAASATEIVIANLKGFRAPATEARRLIDILNEVSNNYATDINELGQGMAGFSPIAFQMNMSMEETAGVLVPVIEVFRSGNEAAIALKTGMLKLIDGSAPVQKALAQLGVSQTEANGALRSGKDILLDVATAFQTKTQAEKLSITSQIVGIQQAARMVEVFDGLAKSTAVTATAMGAAGSATKEVEKRLTSTEVALNRFTSNWENLASAVGGAYQEAAKRAIDGGTTLEKALQGAIKDGSFDPVFDLVKRFGNNLGKALEDIAANIPEAMKKVDFSSLVSSFENLGDSVRAAMKKVFGDLDLSTPEGVADLIQGITDGISALQNVTAGLIDGLGPLFSAMGTGIEHFNQWDEKTQALVGNIFGLAKTVNTVLGILPAFGTAVAVFSGVKMLGALEHVGKMTKALTGLSFSIGALQGAFVVLAASVAFGTWLNANSEGVRQFGESLTDLANRVFHFVPEVEVDWDGYAKSINQLNKRIEAEELAKLHPEVEVTVSAEGSDAAEILAFLNDPQPVDVHLGVSVDAESVAAAKEAMLNLVPKSTFELVPRVDKNGREWMESVETITMVAADRSVSVEPELDDEKAKKAKAKIDRDFSVKMLDIQADVDIARLKATSDTIQTSIEWEARIDIAEAEAAAHVLTTTIDSLGASFADTGDTMRSMFGELSGLSSIEIRNMEKYLEREMRNREALVALQAKLTEAQIHYLDARADAANRGTAELIVNADGLKPHLTAIWMEILEEIRVLAATEGRPSEFLLGLT